jgi:hypothetical protein
MICLELATPIEVYLFESSTGHFFLLPACLYLLIRPLTGSFGGYVVCFGSECPF